MKWLLHSKRFKKNLFKWLFLYIGVMCALTSVITYSRYITSMQSSDTARAAKFDVTVKDICNTLTNTKCNLDSVRPTNTNTFDYYFELDTTNLEVLSSIYLYVYVYDDFDINNDVTLKEYNVSTKEESNLTGTVTTGHTGSYNYYKIEKTISPGAGDKIDYKLSINYSLDSDYKEEHNYLASNGKALVRVGYSAMQIN